MDVGVIGVGNMGKNHVRVYSELRWVNNLYIYDVDPKKVAKLKDKHEGAIVCNSIDEVLKKVDAVSVCVPTKYHFITAKKCIENGVNVLVEKPVVSNPSEGEELLKLKNREDLIFGVGHIERFNPIVPEINKLIEVPKYLEIKRHNPSSVRIKDTSVVEDLMIHDIDLVWNNFFKDIPKYMLYSFGNENFCKVIVRFEDYIVSLSASRISCKKIRTIYVEDKTISIEGDFMDQEVYVYRRPTKYSAEDDKYVQENIIEKVLVNKVEPLKQELKKFIECVKHSKQFPVTLEQGLLNLKIVDEIKHKLLTSHFKIAENKC
ncbi:MAG: Gfo/Idh/MocA family oxidoreductase [Candidatus Odinarchaeia archaeon]